MLTVCAVAPVMRRRDCFCSGDAYFDRRHGLSYAANIDQAPHMKKIILTSLFVFALLGAGCNGAQSLPSSQAEAPTAAVGKTRIEAFDDSRLEGIIRQMFDDLDSKNYQEAYGYFSAGFQKSHPFLEWNTGYKDTPDHEITSIDCVNGTCVVDVVATEISKENIRKQRYVLKYGFVTDVSAQPTIDYGALLSNNTVEVIKSFDAPKEAAVPAALKPTPEIVVPAAPAPKPTPPPTPPSIPERSCCKYCSAGKACGDSCISRSYTCHKAPGCACDS